MTNSAKTRPVSTDDLNPRGYPLGVEADNEKTAAEAAGYASARETLNVLALTEPGCVELAGLEWDAHQDYWAHILEAQRAWGRAQAIREAGLRESYNQIAERGECYR